MQLVISAIVFLAVVTSGCGSGPKISDRFYPDDNALRPPLKTMLKAPIVVVGTVEAVRRVGGVRRSVTVPELLLELLELTVRVENVLKGTVSAPRIKTYYFMFSAHDQKVSVSTDRQKLFGLHPYTPVLHERLVFFLEVESGIMRSVGDVNDYTLRVYSGTHEGLEAPHGASLGESISWVLMTPGRGLQVERFATFLGRTFALSAELCSDACALALLHPLLSSSNLSVRKEANELDLALRR